MHVQVIQVAVIETELKDDDDHQPLDGDFGKMHQGIDLIRTVPETQPHAAHQGERDQRTFGEHQEHAFGRYVLVKDANHSKNTNIAI